MAKESGLRIRVEENLRLDFLKACHENDLTASQVIRRFMKQYVEEELPASALQTEMFPSNKGADDQSTPA